MVAGQPGCSRPCITRSKATAVHRSLCREQPHPGAIGEQIYTKGKHDGLFLQDKVQVQTRFQVKFISVSEIFSTDISHIFAETLLGLLSWIGAKQQFTQHCDSFICFLYTVWLFSYLALAEDSQHMPYVASQSDFLVFLDLITKKKKKKSDRRPGFF